MINPWPKPHQALIILPIVCHARHCSSHGASPSLPQTMINLPPSQYALDAPSSRAFLTSSLLHVLMMAMQLHLPTPQTLHVSLNYLCPYASPRFAGRWQSQPMDSGQLPVVAVGCILSLLGHSVVSVVNDGGDD